MFIVTLCVSTSFIKFLPMHLGKLKKYFFSKNIVWFYIYGGFNRIIYETACLIK